MRANRLRKQHFICSTERPNDKSLIIIFSRHRRALILRISLRNKIGLLLRCCVSKGLLHDFLPSELALSHNNPYRSKHTSDHDDFVIRHYPNASRSPHCIDFRGDHTASRFLCQNITSNYTFLRSSFCHTIPITDVLDKSSSFVSIAV